MGKRQGEEQGVGGILQELKSAAETFWLFSMSKHESPALTR